MQTFNLLNTLVLICFNVLQTIQQINKKFKLQINLYFPRLLLQILGLSISVLAHFHQQNEDCKYKDLFYIENRRPDGMI